MLGPDSHGFFDDPEVLNVVWCNDLECCTSISLARFDALKIGAMLEESRKIFLEERTIVLACCRFRDLEASRCTGGLTFTQGA